MVCKCTNCKCKNNVENKCKKDKVVEPVVTVKDSSKSKY